MPAFLPSGVQAYIAKGNRGRRSWKIMEGSSTAFPQKNKGTSKLSIMGNYHDGRQTSVHLRKLQEALL